MLEPVGTTDFPSSFMSKKHIGIAHDLQGYLSYFCSHCVASYPKMVWQGPFPMI